MDRRTFLKLAGAGGLSVAAGCSPDPDHRLYSLVNAPDDMVTGRAAWYATVCRECPAGCGVLAKNREGRAIKLEGNPLHPVNRGALCSRGQAALQGLYNPDRLRRPLLKSDGRWNPISFDEAESLVREKLAAAASDTRVIGEVAGDTVLSCLNRLTASLKAPAPLLFEPYAYESLKTANRMVFGVDGLCAYRLDEADLILCLGADFLETWLSSVEYARQFKTMHTCTDAGEKGTFLHVSPWQTLTAVNADEWLACPPGRESLVALACLRAAVAAGRGKGVINDAIRTVIAKAAEPYSPERVSAITGIPTGIPMDRLERIIAAVLAAKKPLILGQGHGAGAEGALAANVAANLLNLILDPGLSRVDFVHRHRVELASRRADVTAALREAAEGKVRALVLHHVDPVFALPDGADLAKSLGRDDLFVVAFSNFMNDTSAAADLIFPTRMSLETWDDYGARVDMTAVLQPTAGLLFPVPAATEVLSRLAGDPAPDARTLVMNTLRDRVAGEKDFLDLLTRGGIFADPPAETAPHAPYNWQFSHDCIRALESPRPESVAATWLAAAPSLRFLDGRGANRPWLAEQPDPLTQVTWQSPVLAHPDTLEKHGIRQGDLVKVRNREGREITAPAYAFHGIHPDVVVISVGQGHGAYGRYASGRGVNPLALLPAAASETTGGPDFVASGISLVKAGGTATLANTDGAKFQYGRKIAMTVPVEELRNPKSHGHGGLTMHEFPLTLPLPEGYDPHRDMYPPHDHQDGYRWGMVVDLDRCIGCGACAIACSAENNVGVVGEERIIEGREMAWIRIERYHRPDRMDKVTFLPMMCQHCDNAPCESVCPVYAPHHGKEGLNNQIYNRCIGTRYCSQNCPYKVRRFNWFTWEWPSPLHLQLNPDVTVRSKGVMEKCSFCVQRIKDGHDRAKNEKRRIKDGEITPACAQTCPTGAIAFGNLADPSSEVRRLAAGPRAYQVMGYLNAKPAVIYLKKAIKEI